MACSAEHAAGRVVSTIRGLLARPSNSLFSFQSSLTLGAPPLPARARRRACCPPARPVSSRRAGRWRRLGARACKLCLLSPSVAHAMLVPSMTRPTWVPPARRLAVSARCPVPPPSIVSRQRVSRAPTSELVRISRLLRLSALRVRREARGIPVMPPDLRPARVISSWNQAVLGSHTKRNPFHLSACARSAATARQCAFSAVAESRIPRRSFPSLNPRSRHPSSSLSSAAVAPRAPAGLGLEVRGANVRMRVCAIARPEPH
jgi:hypothetical protein